MAPRGLEYLPGEILARIASSGPAESVFALTRTCRTLYHACYDTLVFKSIIESRRALWEDPRMLDVLTLSRYIGSKNTLTWARFALADQRAMELRTVMGLVMGLTKGAQSVDDCSFPKDRENWIPHLIIAGYPISQLPYWLHLRFHSVHGVKFMISLKDRFCFAAALLSIPTSELDQVPADWSRNEIRSAQEESLSESINTLGAFALILRRAISSGRTNRLPQSGPVAAPFVKPPSALDIPMLPIDSTYQLPVPFHSIHTDPYMVEDPWTAWLHRHVAKSSEPEFLMSGQWCGYYDYNGARAFDPPMVAIQFTVGPSLRNTDMTAWKIQGQGHDGIGRFTLEGVIFVDGRLRLRKLYVGTHAYDWRCFMTPFGISGSWGFQQEQGFHKSGTLWLWKHEWNAR